MVKNLSEKKVRQLRYFQEAIFNEMKKIVEYKKYCKGTICFGATVEKTMEKMHTDLQEMRERFARFERSVK